MREELRSGSSPLVDAEPDDHAHVDVDVAPPSAGAPEPKASPRPRRRPSGRATGTLLLLCLALVATTAVAVATLRGPADADAPGGLPAAGAGPPWVLAHEDRFDVLDRSVWGAYDGPGNGGTGPRSADNAFVRDGRLVLRTTPVDGEWKAAGVSSAPGGWGQTYGRYEVRLRFERGYGVRAVALLWPSSGSWPPEIDFFEVAATDPERTRSFLTNHYRRDGEGHGRGLRQQSVRADFTQWHTVGVEWTPDEIVYLLDGEDVARVSADVPSEPMWLGIQTAQGQLSRGIVPDESVDPAIDLEVDWVRVYRYEPTG